MKKIIILIFLLFQFTISYSSEILKITKLPYKDAEIERIYKLDNGNFIYIEQWVRGNIIWEYNPLEDKFKRISQVWSFLDLAKKCDQIKKNNIYFANNLEYWFAGGTNIDYPEIRIFDLYDPSPWRTSDLGITPDMEYAKSFCIFYKPYYMIGN